MTLLICDVLLGVITLLLPQLQTTVGQLHADFNTSAWVVPLRYGRGTGYTKQS